MCWYVIILDGEIAHLGAEPHETKALAESSAENALAKRSAEGLGFPHALLELPEPFAASQVRWYVLALVDRVAFVCRDEPCTTEAEARTEAVRRYARWALLRVCGVLPTPSPMLQQRSRNCRPRARAHQPRV